MRRPAPALRPVPPEPPPDTPLAVAPQAAGGPPSPGDVAELLHRIECLERDVRAGAADRKIPLDEIAARVNHAPSTLRAWAKDPEKAHLWRLDLLLVASPLPSRELYSTPRLLAQWEDFVRDQMRRVLWGGGLRPGERLVGVAGR